MAKTIEDQDEEYLCLTCAFDSHVWAHLETCLNCGK